MPVEFEEMLPRTWTPVGKLGLRYCVHDVCLSYTMDDPWPLWSGELHARYMTYAWEVSIVGEPWTLREVRKIVWGYIHDIEKCIEKTFKPQMRVPLIRL